MKPQGALVGSLSAIVLTRPDAAVPPTGARGAGQARIWDDGGAGLLALGKFLGH
jgi:hypothetical protein